MTQQPTNYSKFLSFLSKGFLTFFRGSWRKRSIALLSLFLGFYIPSSILAYLLKKIYTELLVILLVLIFEVQVRTRKGFKSSSIESFLIVIDNFRIGITFAIVLEAFKLGS